MPRKPLPPYECPKCGMKTEYRMSMHRHLYELKKSCCGIVRQMELTDEIKLIIMCDRIYHVPQQPAQDRVIISPAEHPTNVISNQTNNNHINNQINNHNQIVNYIANMDVQDKLERVMEYTQEATREFEDRVEDMYKREDRNFKRDSFKGGVVTFNEQHFLDMVSNVTDLTKASNLEEYSFFYDPRTERICFYVDSQWESNRKYNGLQFLIKTITLYQLESYEVYLIRKIYGPASNMHTQSKLDECLTLYYRFISVFDIEPYVYHKHDYEIMDSIESVASESDNKDTVEANRIVDACRKRYILARDGVTPSVKKALQKEVFDIVRTNSNSNIRALNRRIMDIIKVDDEFKQRIMLV